MPKAAPLKFATFNVNGIGARLPTPRDAIRARAMEQPAPLRRESPPADEQRWGRRWPCRSRQRWQHLTG